MDNDAIAAILKQASELGAVGRYDDALLLLAPVESEHRDSPQVLGVLAGIHWQKGDVVLARQLFEEVTQMSPRAELASVGLFHCLWDLGLQTEAKREVERFLTIRSSNEYEQLLREMGWVLVDGKLVDQQEGSAEQQDCPTE